MKRDHHKMWKKLGKKGKNDGFFMDLDGFEYGFGEENQ